MKLRGLRMDMRRDMRNMRGALTEGDVEHKHYQEPADEGA